MKNAYPLCFIASLVLYSISLKSLATTELYQWVDEHGVKHFSQQPPSHLPALKPVDVHGAPIISGKESQSLETVSADNAEEENRPKEIERIENPEKDPERCEKARKNIAQIEQYRRVRAKDPETGELRYLDDNEKTEQLKNWKEREATFC